MICLAVNTATTLLSIALAREGETLFHYRTSETRDQGNLLLAHIGKGLARNGLGYPDIGLLAVVTGPGSFTGIRIGLATMRGLGLAADIPVTGISSFDLFAQKEEDRKNIVAVESWREELYFRLEGQEPVNMSPENFAAGLSGDFIVSGDAREKLRPFLSHAVYADSDPDAVHLAQLAIAQKGRYTVPEPFYLRPADVTLSSNIRKIAD